ncbi:hypothetical protein PV326_013353 [Microctonus aethiopoides]|nr:hypothetical protein PV326_013353 [Microctonus aethiopoides]
MSTELWLAIAIAVSSLTSGVDTQMTWTPIFIGGANQVDFWTSSETGCVCNFNSSRQDCACCVVSGGCSCGTIMPKRCTQCGLEQHCSNMCNITLDSKELFNKSNRGFGQIKSPSVVGPTACTYKFIPDTGQRLELQVYRLLAIGRHNGKTCEGGWLQLDGGARICGSNARFDRPVVLFSDKSQVILHMQINEHTTRSQFLAYFSFASKASPSVGWPMKGGIAVNNSELLVEFNSGAEIAPFNWNGFHARVSVAEITTIAPITVATKASKLEKSGSNIINNNSKYSNRDLKNLHQETVSGTNSCNFLVDGDQSRSGHYDTRDRVKISSCHLVLRGRLYDTVHLFLTSYNLRRF